MKKANDLAKGNWQGLVGVCILSLSSSPSTANLRFIYFIERVRYERRRKREEEREEKREREVSAVHSPNISNRWARLRAVTGNRCPFPLPGLPVQRLQLKSRSYLPHLQECGNQELVQKQSSRACPSVRYQMQMLESEAYPDRPQCQPLNYVSKGYHLLMMA